MWERQVKFYLYYKKVWKTTDPSFCKIEYLYLVTAALVCIQPVDECRIIVFDGVLYDFETVLDVNSFLKGF